MRKNQESMSPSPTPIRFEEAGASSIAGTNGPFVDTIRARAYHLYEVRMVNNAFGDPLSDWLQAEQQVRMEFANGNDNLA